MTTPGYMKRRIPEFKDESDDELNFWIGEAIEYLGGASAASCWGNDFKLAVVYLAAHELKSAREQTDEGTGLVAGEGLVGRVQSVKTFDWSINMASQNAAQNAADEELMTTVYGQKFLALRDRQSVDLTYSYRNR